MITINVTLNEIVKPSFGGRSDHYGYKIGYYPKALFVFQTGPL